MPRLKGSSPDRSATALLFYPPPESADPIYIGFFLNSEARSLLNFAGQTAAVSTSTVLNGAPSFPAAGAAGISGLDFANSVATTAAETGAITIMLVFSIATGYPAAIFSPIGNTTDFDGKGIYLATGAVGYGLRFAVGFLDSAAAKHKVEVVTTQDQGSTLQASLQSPGFYVLTVNPTGSIISVQGFSPLDPNANAPVTTAIPSGYTRNLSSSNFILGGAFSGWNGLTTAHFMAVFPRATTSSENAAWYAKVQSLLALYGVTI